MKSLAWIKTDERERCKHQGKRFVRRWIPIEPGLVPKSIIAETDVCVDCGKWFSVGESSDRSAAVKIEIRLATMLACHFADDYPCRCFDRRRLLRDASDEKEVRRIVIEIAADRMAA